MPRGEPVPVPVPVPTAAVQEEAAASQPEIPTFDGLQGVELCRAVCAWLMATAPKTGRDAESRLAAGEERLARLVHTLSTAGLLTGTAETLKCVEDFCAFLQGRYFDGITTDEHGAEARSRARNNNRLVEQLCSKQHFREMADSMPQPTDGHIPQNREELSDKTEPDCTSMEEHVGIRDGPEVEKTEVLGESGEDDSEAEDEELEVESEEAAEDEDDDDENDHEHEEQQEEARMVSPERHWHEQELRQRQAQEDQRRCYQRHEQQLRQQRQAHEHAEALARQRRRYSDPFAAYHQQHPLFSSARPVGAWGVPRSRPRSTIDRMRGGIGPFGFPVMLY